MFDDLAFKEDIKNNFGGFRDTVGVLNKQYNIAPTLNIAMYTNAHVYTYAHFGLIPSWAKGRGSMQMNARSETVFEKSSFKEAYKQRRCLIPVNGYFEWKKDPETKSSQAYFIVSSEHPYFVFAGIYEWWYDNALKKPILTVALLTTEPNNMVDTIHDRMPVILEQHQWKVWLDDKSTYADLNTFYEPLASEKMRYFSVGEMVNSVRNDGVGCIEEVQAVGSRQRSLF